MSLYLVRHGRYLSADQDPEKGLSEYGSEEIRQVATQIKKYNPHLSCITHSGKKRALQTAQIFASVLSPHIQIKESSDINPNDDVIKFNDKINNSKNEMLVGHLPFLEKLVSYLITNSPENKVVDFSNGTTVCLDKEFENWVIKWVVLPGVE